MPLSGPQPALGMDATPAFMSTATPGDSSGNRITRCRPCDIRGAYGFTSAMTGAGQTVAIVVAYNVFDETAVGFPNHTLQTDLNTFSSEFGLPKTTIRLYPDVAQQSDQRPPVDLVRLDQRSSDGHRVCSHDGPKCQRIVLVEAASTSTCNARGQAANQAAKIPGVSVVSMSFGGHGWLAEQCV